MKIKLPKALRLALIAISSLYCTSTTLAQNVTWTAASVNGTVNQTFTESGIITLGDNITVDSLTINLDGDIAVAIFGGTTAETQLISTGGLTKLGEGRLLLGGQFTAGFTTAPVFAMTGVLDVREGMVQFGQRASNEAEQVDIAFSEIIIAAGAIFEHRSFGTSHDNTAVTLDGGTYQNFGTGASRTVTFSHLTVKQDSAFNFKFGGIYKFQSITGTGNLGIGEYDIDGVAFEFEDVGMSFAKMTDYSGTISVTVREAYKSRLLELSEVEQNGVTATINGLDVTGTDFSMSGSGGLTIGSSLILGGNDAVIRGGTLTVASLGGTSNLTITTADGNTGQLITTAAGLNGYTGDISIDGGELTLNGAGIISTDMTIGAGGAKLNSDVSLDLDNTILFDSNTSSISANNGLDISGTTLDLIGFDRVGSYTLLTTTDGVITAGAFTSTGLGESVFTVELSPDEKTLTLNITSFAGFENLVWAGGDGTWATGDATLWNTPVGTATYGDGDFITFGSADTAITGGTVTITGTVTPGSLSFVGAQDYTLTGAGSIAGDTSLVMNGTGIVTISTANTYTGGTQINSGTLVIGVAGALGTGATVVAADAALGLGYTDAIGDIGAITFNTNSTIALIGGITYTTTDTITGKLVAGVSLSLASGTARVGGVSGTDTRYARTTSGYTVFVGDGATLTDNVRLALTGQTTSITGTGVYEVNSLLMSASGATATTLDVAAGATLRILASTTSIVGSDGSFMVSNLQATNTLNIAGTVEAMAGISTRDGKGIINVSDGGNLILRQGLHGVSNSPEADDIVLNIVDNATLTLFNQTTTTNHANIMTVNIADGATVVAASDDVTNIYTDISFADTGTTTLNVAADRTLNFHRDEDFDTLIIDGSGTVQFTGASTVNTVETAVAGSGNINVNNASFSLGTGTDLNTVTLSAGANMEVTTSLSLSSLLMADGTTMTLSGDSLKAALDLTRVISTIEKLNDTQNMTVQALADNAAVSFSQASNVHISNAQIGIAGESLVYSLSDSTLDASSLEAEQINFISNNRVENSTLNATDTITFTGAGAAVTLANSNVDLTKFTGSGGVTLENYTWAHTGTLTQTAVGSSLVYTVNSGLAASLQTAISESLTLTITMTDAEFADFERSLTSGIGIELGGIDALTNIALNEDIFFSILVGAETREYTFNSQSSINNNVLLSLASNSWISVSGQWTDATSWSAAVPNEDNVALFAGEGSENIRLLGDNIALNTSVSSATKNYTMNGGENDSLSTGSLSILAGTFTLNATAKLLGQIGTNDTEGILAISSGAELVVDSEGNLSALLANLADGSSLTIKAGAEVSVEGAMIANSAAISNEGSLILGAGSQLGTLDDAGGQLSLQGDSSIETLTSSNLEIAQGVTLSGSNATLSGFVANAGTISVDTLTIAGTSNSTLGSVDTMELILDDLGQIFGDLKVDTITSNVSISTSTALLSVSSISSLTATTAIELGDLQGFDISTAVGSYIIIGKNSSTDPQLNWDNFTLDANDLSIFNTQKLNGFDIILDENAEGSLVINISLADRRIWSTSNDVGSTPGLENSDPSMFFPVIGADGKVLSYDALNQIDIVNVDSDRLVDLTGLSLDPTDTQGLLMNNLQGEAGRTLTITGESIANSLVTLNNDEDSFALNDISINNATVQLTGENDATLMGAGIALNQAALEVQSDARMTVDAISLESSSLNNGAGGSFTTDMLNGDSGSSLSGLINISGSGGDYQGSYNNATVNSLAGASQTLNAAAGLTLSGAAGTLTLTNAAGGTIAGINSNGANININLSAASTTTQALTLTNNSSMSAGSLNIVLNRDFVESNQSQQIIAGGALNMGSGSTLNISVELGEGTLNFADYPTTVELLSLSDGSSIDGDIELGQNLSKYFINIRFDSGIDAILADFNTEFYTVYAQTENGRTGLDILSQALRSINPQNNPTIYPDLAAVMNELDTMLSSNPAEADRLGAAVAGASSAGLGMAQSESLARQLRKVRDRATSLYNHQASMYEDTLNVQGWISAEGSSNELDSDGTESGYQLDSWGGSVGADYSFNNDFSMGIALTANQGNYSASDIDNLNSDFNSSYMSIYAYTQTGNWSHSLIISAGLTDVSGERTVSYSGGQYTASMGTDGYGFGALYELAYNIMSDDETTIWQPLFNISFQSSTLNAYTESSSDAALRFGEQSMSYATLGLGGRMVTTFGENVYNRAASFSLRAMLTADLGDTQSKTDSSLSIGGFAGEIHSAERGNVGAEVGVGLQVPVMYQGRIFFDASCEIRSNSHSVNGTIGYSFTF